MPSFLRSLILACIFLGVTLGLITTIAIAKTYHRHRVVAHHTVPHSSAMVRTAQTHLAHLGYYKSKIDGITGPKTVAALKAFQHDHHFHVTGMLTTQTYNALAEADRAAPGGSSMASNSRLEAAERSADFYATHPDFYGHYDQQYADPMLLSSAVIGSGDAPAVRSQAVPSRFGKIDVSENNSGNGKRYSITLNGQPVFQADDQPAVIGISRTFDLGNEDAIVVSAYHNENTTCPYKHFLLTLASGTNNVQEISNCTHGYQAKVKDGSLFIVFPESDDGRAVGNTWRYENNHLERL